jgi:hypothetical protein
MDRNVHRHVGILEITTFGVVRLANGYDGRDDAEPP